MISSPVLLKISVWKFAILWLAVCVTDVTGHKPFFSQLFSLVNSRLTWLCPKELKSKQIYFFKLKKKKKKILFLGGIDFD